MTAGKEIDAMLKDVVVRPDMWTTLFFIIMAMEQGWQPDGGNLHFDIREQSSNLIQQSVALTSFSLDVPLHNVPSELIESLRSATYLQELSVMGASQGLTQGPSDEWFGGVFIDRFVDHHHPQSRMVIIQESFC